MYKTIDEAFYQVGTGIVPTGTVYIEHSFNPSPIHSDAITGFYIDDPNITGTVTLSIINLSPSEIENATGVSNPLIPNLNFPIIKIPVNGTGYYPFLKDNQELFIGSFIFQRVLISSDFCSKLKILWIVHNKKYRDFIENTGYTVNVDSKDYIIKGLIITDYYK